MKILNQYSLLLTLLGSLVFILFILVRVRAGAWWYLAAGIYAGLFVVLWIFLRPTPSGLLTREAVEERIGQGTPVLLEFHSPY